MTVVVHLNASTSGGAGRAAYRIHKSLNASALDFESTMLALTSDVNDNSIDSIKLGRRQKLAIYLLTRLERAKVGRLQTKNYNYHTTGYPGAGVVPLLNNHRAELVNIHAVGDGLLSIEDITNIRKPIVWTMHDEWGYCGSEHYSELDLHDDSSPTPKRYRAGYRLDNRPPGERGLDLDRLTWERKVRFWTTPMHIVTPSRWLAESAMSSQLMRGWPVNVISYPIDINFWSAVDRCTARQLLQLPQDATLILFGVDHGSANPRKGADLLLKSFRLLHSQVSSARTPTQLVVFGQQLSLPPSNPDVPYHYLGRLRDDLTLKIAYSAVDAIVIPSRQDNLPNIGLEAHACGKPVVAFKVGGLQDIIDDRITGALATPFDPESLAEAIGWVVNDADRRQKLGEHARRRAESLWAESVVAKQYADLYTSILGGGFSG